MSDIIFVCVSADIDLAEALADVFETAGHAIGDSEEDARTTIVIWSHASRRSEAFLDAAKRATDAGTAIFVSREGLAAASIEGAPVFDLSAWNGDPDSSEIDALFNTVDRKLVIARFDHAADEDELDRGVKVIVASSDEFQPRRVHTNTRAFKRAAPGFGDAARALAFIAVLAGGAFGLTMLRGAETPEVPAAHAAIAPEVTPEQPTQTAMRVTFADAVTSDASLDEVVPPEASLPTGYRGREPPSVSSLSRRERARAAFRETAYVPDVEQR